MRNAAENVRVFGMLLQSAAKECHDSGDRVETCRLMRRLIVKLWEPNEPPEGLLNLFLRLERTRVGAADAAALLDRQADKYLAEADRLATKHHG